MSAQREELLRLVEELPETEVPAVLDDVRRHLRAVKNRSWPSSVLRRRSEQFPQTWRPAPRTCSTTGSAA
jgi:hypothetical protein